MKTVTIHFGPEKCGSTTIMNALKQGAKGGLFEVWILPPAFIIALSQRDPVSLLALDDGLQSRLARADHVVLSHEMLFKFPDVIVEISMRGIALADKVKAIGYVRPQSSYIISVFGQWLFRSLPRLRENRFEVSRMGFDPDLFTGVECHLIAAIQTGLYSARQLSDHLYLNWAKSFGSLRDHLTEVGGEIAVWHLPWADDRFDLVADFYRRAGLKYPANLEAPQERNKAFHPDVVEASSLALLAGLEMPGPHDHNPFFARVSLLRPDAAEGRLVETLRHAIDTAMWPENQQFCEAFEVPSDIFNPQKVIAKDDVREALETESRIRSNIPLAERQAISLEKARAIRSEFSAYLAAKGLAPS